MPLKIGNPLDHGFAEPLGLLSDCHRRIEHFLETFIVLNDRLRGGELSLPNRAALEGAIRYFATAAPKHTADEEESLFPRLRASDDPGARRALGTVARLERDHADADRYHKVVDELARRWLAQGTLDEQDVAVLGDALTALKAIYGEHIGIEDRDLFPAAAQALSPDELKAIGREMAERRKGN
jgi:hemerythrin-like domain-containing protein